MIKKKDPLYDHTEVNPLVTLIEHAICNSIKDLTMDSYNEKVIIKILEDFKEKKYLMSYEFDLTDNVVNMKLRNYYGINLRSDLNLVDRVKYKPDGYK